MINKELYSVAYLSMEIALENNIKTYAGGLGVLAGDILKSAAGKEFPMLGISLINNEGYFKQIINKHGEQKEVSDKDYDFSLLKKLDTEIELNIGADKIKIGVWEYIIKSANAFKIPVYFLDANLKSNKKEYRNLTMRLYGGDLEYRLRQEIILGRGGVKILQALGYKNIKKYHLNEGHGALTAIELYNQFLAGGEQEKIQEVKKICVFTTHTPIKTVYDEFPQDLLLKNQADFPANLEGLIENKKLNSLNLAMYFSSYINGVSKRHQALLNNIFPEKNIQAITNGVNSLFWTAPEFKDLYDKYLKGWENNNSLLKQAINIPSGELWVSHQKAKRRLLQYISKKQKNNWKDEVFTIGFARRFTSYKQPLLLFSDVERLIDVLETSGQAQIVIAGKAHRRDKSGQEAIQKIYQIKKEYPHLNIIFLENYNLDIAQLLVAGVDLWLNVPLPPLEASGTSGMKAAHNGVPQLGTLDGWWLEGYVKNKTGWAIENADELYNILKTEVIPLYYNSPEDWREIMKNTISWNASYFNSDRALEEYIAQAYK
ncbi:MAG: alpha-glucan family phosphorylase [Candidatus Falkowbacteria bacterium]